MIADPANLLWADALQQLKCRMARDTFNTWLLGSRVVDSGQDALTIGILHPNGLPWLQRYLRPVIEQTLHLVAGRPIAVDFVAYSPEQEDEYVESASDEGLDDEDGNEEYEKEEDEEEFDDDEGDTEYEQEEDDEEVGRGDPRPTSCSASKAPHRGSTEHAGRAGRRNGRNKPAKELGPNDFYIKVKTAFRRRALRLCKGAPLSVLNCLWCHVNDRSLAWPSIETIMRETGYSRGVVCNAIAKLERLGLIVKRPRRSQSTEYAITAYASFGPKLAPCLFEEQED